MNEYKTLPRNARVCIAVEPLWALFGPIVQYYMPVYQRALGLSEVQMGVVNSAHIAAGFLFFMIAAPITNRFGRRRTSLYFDLVAWSSAMLVWAFAGSFSAFLIAGIMNAVVRIVIVSWNLLITEDAQNSQRASIHGWIYLIGSVSGFITFAGGLLIDRFGIVPAMRVICLSGGLSMTAMFVVRYALTRETAAGIALLQRSRAIPFARAVLSQIPSAGIALREPGFLRRLGIFFVANAVLYMDFYRILFLQESKLLPAFAIAVLPAFGAALSIGLFLFVMPRLKHENDAALLEWAMIGAAAAQGLMILMPAGSLALAILAAGCLQTGYFLVQSFRDALFMNYAQAGKRGELFSLVQALTFLLSIPFGWFAGFLYSVNPALPFALAALLYLGGAFLARAIRREKEAA